MTEQTKLKGASCPSCAGSTVEYKLMKDAFTSWGCPTCAAWGKVEDEEPAPAVMSDETARQIAEQIGRSLRRAMQRNGPSSYRFPLGDPNPPNNTPPGPMRVTALPCSTRMRGQA